MSERLMKFPDSLVELISVEWSHDHPGEFDLVIWTQDGDPVVIATTGCPQSMDMLLNVAPKIRGALTTWQFARTEGRDAPAYR